MIMKKNEEAFTGLEAAIVLIAFVVVAAVFSFVVLGAGLFTTQKSHEVVYAGVGSAASNMVVKGDVYGISTTTPTEIVYIQFDVGLAAGGYPIDASKLTMIYSDTTNTPRHLLYQPQTGWDTTLVNPDPGNWTMINKAGSDTSNYDDILKYGQTFTIRTHPLADMIPPRQAFHIEFKPEIGASIAISRSVPPSLTATTLLT
jgi:flagellin FlaB